MKTVNRFKKIGEFRNVIRNVVHKATYIGLGDDGNVLRDMTAKLPTITFTGTTKLHGTNASVRFDSDGGVLYQSRRCVLSVEKDNAGFAFFAKSNVDVFTNWNKLIRESVGGLEESSVLFFGEWCGGNIQKGTALTGLDKMFVLFAVKIVPNDEEQASYYLKKCMFNDLRSKENQIYNIYDYKTFEIDIDFSNPTLSQNAIVDLVEEVENECPVGKAFGRKYGEDCTIGEGIVWVGWYDDNQYVFKTKGQKHSTSRVKKIASVDVEKLDSVVAFVDYAVTTNRLNQGIEQVFTIKSIEPNKKMTGDYIRWVIVDILSEEADTLSENGLEPKDVQKQIMFAARNWYFEYLDSLIF